MDLLARFIAFFLDFLPRFLRLFIGVILDVVAFVFSGVDVRATEIFSGSESKFAKAWWSEGFLVIRAMSFNFSF